MTRITLSASFLALATVAQPGWSLTAEEAWQAWQQLAADYGQTVTADSTAKSGNALTLTGMNYALKNDEFEITGTTDLVVLTEQPDGSVVMTGSDESALKMVSTPAFGDGFEAKVRYTHPDMQIIASDSGGVTSFAYALPSLGLELIEVMVEGAPFDLKGAVTVGTITGSYSSTGGLSPTITQSYSTGPFALNAEGSDPRENSTFKMDMSLANLSGSGTSTGGSLYASDDMAAQLKAGVAAQGSGLGGPFGLSIMVNSPSDSVDIKFTGASFEVSGALDKDKANYNLSYSGLNLDLSGSEIPLPLVQVALQDLGISVLAPLAPSDQPVPFVAKTTFGGLKLGDPLWNLLDPAAVLPRDPATLVIDLAGQVRLLADLLTPESMMGQDAPGELHSLSINEILLTLAGAKLTANGAFTFDNSDMTTFDGFPRPTGSLSLTLLGANGLLDKLVQMGLVPQDQAMGMRMMSGMVLRPGDGPDTLTSDIQITPEGRITANGMPMPF